MPPAEQFFCLMVAPSQWAAPSSMHYPVDGANGLG
jgi:hypothetical protein